MTAPGPIALSGAPGSPYTRKMLAVLRYRRLPYRFLVGSHGGRFAGPMRDTVIVPPHTPVGVSWLTACWKPRWTSWVFRAGRCWSSGG